jgi:hypothetical protein
MNKLYIVNITNNVTDFDYYLDMSYFFSNFNAAKKFANEKYNDINKIYEGYSCEKINDKHYYIYQSSDKSEYFQIKINKINLNSNNNNNNILYECGKKCPLDEESLYTQIQEDRDFRIQTYKDGFSAFIIIACIITFIYFLGFC